MQPIFATDFSTEHSRFRWRLSMIQAKSTLGQEALIDDDDDG
jgi:hypothetical protein